MKLSRTHLEAINESRPGELEVALHPTKPMLLIQVVGTAVTIGMEAKQVDALMARLAHVRRMIKSE